MVAHEGNISCSVLKCPNKYDNIATASAMLYVLYLLSLIFANGCLKRTFARKTGSLSDCKVYYRTQERPKTSEGISTRYFGPNCNDLLFRVEDNVDYLPDAPRDIDVRVHCKNRTADIVWSPRVSNDMARKLYGFLLEAQLTNRQYFTSTFVCYGIFMNETLSSLLLNNSLPPPEFEFSCFESSPNATLQASIWSISSQDRNACQSLSNCLFMVDQHSKANFDMKSIDEEKWCLDCHCWKPDWRLKIVTNESALCPGLQLNLDNVISTLTDLRLFIIHNETGEAILDKRLNNSMFESRKNVNLASGLQQSGRYYAKLEAVCKLRLPSTCPGITRFISDYVSVSCDVSTMPQPPPPPPFPTALLIFLCVTVVSALFLVLCFHIKGLIKKNSERWNPSSNDPGVSSNNDHNPNGAVESLLHDIEQISHTTPQLLVINAIFF
ncbi:hypothetical protein ACJMK2_015751 [Sinanodonta woodiana]|uniref:Fibronectin type-III domain-containing protein n=1 Tax=Sinanodonta woodiana TaxID=1069815 RepID=A0ABD3URF5_SINWO